MPKVSVVTLDKARAVEEPAGYSGASSALAYFDDEKTPLHLHLHRIAAGETLTIGPMAADCVGYVWHGAVEAGGWKMGQGSSLIVEYGETLEVTGGDGMSELLTFHAAQAPASQRAGGHVHLLPTERVPRQVGLAPSVRQAQGLQTPFDALFHAGDQRHPHIGAARYAMNDDG